MRSTSSELKPHLRWLCLDSYLSLSFAVTVKIPFASMSNVTSTCGMPVVLIDTIQSELSKQAVVFRKLTLTLVPMISICLIVCGCREHLIFLVGTVVLRNLNSTDSTHGFQTKRKGVTSRRTYPQRFIFSKIPPWIAAPKATTSSGFTDWLGFLPKKLVTFSRTRGIRVTHQPKLLHQFRRINTSIFQSQSTWLKCTCNHRLDHTLELWRLRVRSKFGPVASAYRNGREMVAVGPKKGPS